MKCPEPRPEDAAERALSRYCAVRMLETNVDAKYLGGADYASTMNGCGHPDCPHRAIASSQTRSEETR